jgi:hypothetical protein
MEALNQKKGGKSQRAERLMSRKMKDKIDGK